jgi:hypothetical protein
MSGYNSFQASGNLLSATVKTSYEFIKSTFPLELASRMATWLNSPNQDPCAMYFLAAGVNSTQTKVICEKYDFGNVSDVQFFVNGNWFKEDFGPIMEATNMTQ